MKKIEKKVIFTIIFCFVILFFISNNVQALSLGDIYNKGKDFTNVNGSPIDPGKINSLISTIFSIGVGIGILIALIMTTILGIKFILASPSEKAEIKETLIPFAIGLVVIAGAYGIWKLAVSIINVF